MKDQQRSIFREKAMRHYARGRTKSVLPQIARPRVAALLWVFAALLLGCGVLAWLIRIPVYVSGVGVVINTVSPDTVGEGRLLAVFLPEEARSKIHVGQRLFWTLDNGDKRVNSKLVAIETAASSPMAAQSRFQLPGAAAAEITKHVVIAFGQLDQLPGSLPESAYVGSVHHVDIEIGKMRAISMLPFLQRVAGD